MPQLNSAPAARNDDASRAETLLLAIVNIGQLATFRGSGRLRTGAELREPALVRDAALVCEGSRILFTGPAAEMPSVPREAEVIDADGRAVLPGFVDAHTHLVFAGDRLDEFERRVRGESYEQITAAGGGIRSTVRATRTASEEELLELARGRFQRALRGGTTAFEVKSGYGLSIEDEMKMLRVVRRLREETGARISGTFLGPHAVPPEWDGRADEYLALVVEEMLPAVAREGLAEHADIFCERGAFSPAQARRYFAAAQKLGFRLRAHVDQLTESGGAILAAETGCTTADHLEQTGAEGIAALAAARVQPVLLPASVYALGRTRYPDARAMIAAGLAPVLATDFNPGSSPTLAMPMVLSLAATQMRMEPWECLTAATVNAAHSLGWGSELGVLEAGRRADFAIHDVRDPRELAYWFGSDTALATVIGGRVAWRRERW